ncbi:VOC family protein [Agromyces atrinae]|uniref:Catechol-2,3-dioxygenase n=1 Tax=Agromyces atrinae TaxID=592376 RepID=A0A852SKC8_9MICO|nr:catechol-2,3-dioxygenase [Agromyces atrinae]
MPGFHHIELWIADLGSVHAEWSWLLDRVGFTLASEWPTGQSWTAGGSYLTLTESPNLTEPTHDRRRAGLNHLAFRLDDAGAVDSAMAEASSHGWRPL